MIAVPFVLLTCFVYNLTACESLRLFASCKAANKRFSIWNFLAVSFWNWEPPKLIHWKGNVLAVVFQMITSAIGMDNTPFL